MNNICIQCNKEFIQNINGYKKKTCSKKCSNLIVSDKLKGKMPKNLSLINANKKGSGNPMWGKHSSQKQKDAARKTSTGRIKSQEEIEKLRFANSNEKSINWKGDDASYSSIHKWIRKEYGNANKYFCNFCQSKSNLQWSNKNHKYIRSRDDWWVLCRSCHRRYDFKFLKNKRTKI